MAPNCWTIVQKKLVLCGKELLSWSVKKKKLSQQELNEKLKILEPLQGQASPKLKAIRILEDEIGFFLENEDLKWRKRAKKKLA